MYIGFTSSRIKKWFILLAIIPLLICAIKNNINYPENSGLVAVCFFACVLLSTVIFTPNVKLANEKIVIEKLYSNLEYSPNEFITTKHFIFFYSKILFTDNRSYIFFNGRDTFDLIMVKKYNIDDVTSEAIRTYYNTPIHK